jgi:hypothetical protein
MMNLGRKKNSKGSGRVLIDILSRNFLEGTRINDEKASIKITGVPVEIRTEHLLNSSLERHRYVKSMAVTPTLSRIEDVCLI